MDVGDVTEPAARKCLCLVDKSSEGIIAVINDLSLTNSR